MVKSVDFWFRTHYRLPPTDPRYLDTTLEERLSEFWAYQYSVDPKLLEMAEDTSFNMADIQRQWADEAGEQPDVFIPSEPPTIVTPDDVDDWEEV